MAQTKYRAKKRPHADADPEHIDVAGRSLSVCARVSRLKYVFSAKTSRTQCDAISGLVRVFDRLHTELALHLVNSPNPDTTSRAATQRKHKHTDTHRTQGHIFTHRMRAMCASFCRCTTTVCVCAGDNEQQLQKQHWPRNHQHNQHQLHTPVATATKQAVRTLAGPVRRPHRRTVTVVITAPPAAADAIVPVTSIDGVLHRVSHR